MATSSTGCTPNNGQSNSNKGTSAAIMDAIAVGVAALNTAAAIKMALMMEEIAKDYLAIAKWWNNYHKSLYRPCEDKELAEACGAEFYIPDFDTAVGRTMAFGKLLTKKHAEQAIRCTQSYATGMQAGLLRDSIVLEGTTNANMAALGFRNERAYQTAKDDLRWKRRESVLNRGRDMMAANVSMSQMSLGIFGSLATQAGAGAAGALGWLGYNRARNPLMAAPPSGMPAGLRDLPPPGAGDSGSLFVGSEMYYANRGENNPRLGVSHGLSYEDRTLSSFNNTLRWQEE